LDFAYTHPSTQDSCGRRSFHDHENLIMSGDARRFPANRAIAPGYATTRRDPSREARHQCPVNDKDQIEFPRQEHFPNFPLALRLHQDAKKRGPYACVTSRRGKRNVAELADIAGLSRPSADDGADRRMRAAAASAQNLQHDGFTALTSVPVAEWRALAERAIEPNGYYLPAWALAVNASARGRTGVSALGAWRDALPDRPVPIELAPSEATPISPTTSEPARLIGLLPVVSLWRACKIPLPALASASPYGSLCTPLLDRGLAEEAAIGLMSEARMAGAHALILRDVSLGGAAMKAFTLALQQDGLQPTILHSHLRACLDARHEADELLRGALSAKKLKELRRQRNRLAEEHGMVRFAVARSTDEVDRAVDVFLALEASGWKGERGTALQQNEGDLSFIRSATRGLAETGQCEIVTMRAGETPVASAVVLRHQDRAFYFKLGIDERFAKFSPGVQLTLDLTRHLCADAVLATADSTASADHPMINPIWRGRLKIGDVIIPLRRNDPVVSAIQLALTARHRLRDVARTVAHRLRNR
jgi:Acetyltransferase (GNAT) domain